MDIVLIRPEIPQNTGSIARTCAATQTPLHLVGELGFEITEKQVRRAGLDYWPYVSVHHHKDWDEYHTKHTPHTIWLFSKFAERPYYDPEFSPGDALVFGNETKGLGKDFLCKFPKTQQLLIPMKCDKVRSLNLSNAVSIALYEVLKQTGEV